MHIDFARSGGFAGMRLATQLDTGDLPAEQASNLDKLIQDANFFELPEKLMPDRPAPDRFEYRLTLDSGKQKRSIVVNDAAAPESLQPLLKYLTTLAMTQKR